MSCFYYWFKKSIEYFVKSVSMPDLRNDSYRNIVEQARFVDAFLKIANTTDGDDNK